MLKKIYSIRYIFQKALARGKMHGPVCVIKWKYVSVRVDIRSPGSRTVLEGRQATVRGGSLGGGGGGAGVGGGVLFTLCSLCFLHFLPCASVTFNVKALQLQ